MYNMGKLGGMLTGYYKLYALEELKMKEHQYYKLKSL